MMDWWARLGPTVFEQLVIMGSAWRPDLYNMAAWSKFQVEEVDGMILKRCSRMMNFIGLGKWIGYRVSSIKLLSIWTCIVYFIHKIFSFHDLLTPEDQFRPGLVKTGPRTTKDWRPQFSLVFRGFGNLEDRSRSQSKALEGKKLDQTRLQNTFECGSVCIPRWNFFPTLNILWPSISFFPYQCSCSANLNMSTFPATVNGYHASCLFDPQSPVSTVSTSFSVLLNI